MFITWNDRSLALRRSRYEGRPARLRDHAKSLAPFRGFDDDVITRDRDDAPAAGQRIAGVVDLRAWYERVSVEQSGGKSLDNADTEQLYRSARRWRW